MLHVITITHTDTIYGFAIIKFFLLIYYKQRQHVLLVLTTCELKYFVYCKD